MSKPGKINKIALITAGLSFVVGTLLLLIFYCSCSHGILIFSFFYTIATGLINSVILFILIWKAWTDYANRNRYLKTSVVMLLNIPVVILYGVCINILLNTIRITFINDTDQQISELKVTGYKPEIIDSLRAGEKNTVWIKITGDGCIKVEYKINEHAYNDVVCGYVTLNMGGKVKHKISKKKQ